MSKRNELTTREIQVLNHMAEGFTTGEIATRIKLAPATVGDYKKRLFSKLYVNNAAQAVAEGFHKGWLSQKVNGLKESEVEKYLAQRVKEVGGEVRKVRWVGRSNAPDRLVMLPPYFQRTFMTIWVELKNPDTIKTFPANAHERAQQREHERMRAMGQRVEVVGTIEQVDALLP